MCPTSGSSARIPSISAALSNYVHPTIFWPLRASTALPVSRRFISKIGVRSTAGAPKTNTGRSPPTSPRWQPFTPIRPTGTKMRRSFSVIYPDGRYPRLSPAYDMVPVIAYLGAGRYALNEEVEKMYQSMSLDDFLRVAKAAHFAPRAVAREIRQTLERICDVWPAALKDLPVPDELRMKILARIDGIALLRSALPRRFA